MAVGVVSIILFIFFGKDMPKNKPNAGSSAGDWSNTGTFVRKPATGWLHRDLDLTDGAYVKYRLNVRCM